jgi:hypothetical protein
MPQSVSENMIEKPKLFIAMLLIFIYSTAVVRLMDVTYKFLPHWMKDHFAR